MKRKISIGICAIVLAVAIGAMYIFTPWFAPETLSFIRTNRGSLGVYVYTLYSNRLLTKGEVIVGDFDIRGFAYNVYKENVIESVHVNREEYRHIEELIEDYKVEEHAESFDEVKGDPSDGAIYCMRIDGERHYSYGLKFYGDTTMVEIIDCIEGIIYERG